MSLFRIKCFPFRAEVSHRKSLPTCCTGSHFPHAELKGLYACILVISTWSVTVFAEHTPLLPAPQRVQYGAAHIELRNVSIRLQSKASIEDAFAAKTLSSCLSKASNSEIPIRDGPGKGIPIILRRTGSIDPLPLPNERGGPNSREAYSIHINTERGEIEARTSAGLYYGVQTMCQMIEPSTATASAVLPEIDVEDWPAMAYRGTMVDMSEGPLPTEAEIKRQIDFLARWKVNQYYFYSETSIALDGYPLLSENARYTQQQIREIISYARERHIDVIPSLELFGHLHDLFRIEKYSSLADFPHGVEFNPKDPRVMRLLAGWIDQFSRLFPSAFVNIGFDETWQIQEAAQHGGMTPTHLFIQQLQDVSRLFQQHQKTVMAWGDIMVKYPNIVADLPPGIIAIAWWYEPYPDKEYKKWIVPLVDHHIPYFIAPGVHSWNEIAPDYTLSFDNIDTFLVAGRKSNAIGIMNTIWTDDAQMLMRPTWPGLAYGAAAGWQTTPVDRATFFHSYTTIQYPVAAKAMASALESLAASETALQCALGQDTMIELWEDPFEPEILNRTSKHQDDLRKSRLLAEDAQEQFLRARGLGVGREQLHSFLVESRLLDYAGLKFLYSIEIASQWKALGLHPDREQLENDFENIVVSPQHGKIGDLMDLVTELQPEYRQAWLEEYTSYRLGSALGRWNAEYEYWRRLQTNLSMFISNYDPSHTLPDFTALAPSNEQQ